METKLNRQEIFKGKVIHVVKDEVSLDNGKTSYREVALHNGGVCIALKNDDYYYLVKQYRYALGKYMLEFPAGKIEVNEEPDKAILREAIEETGYSVKNIKKLGSIVPTCGYSSEIIYLYYGEVDEHIGQHFDEDESIVLEKYTLTKIKEMIKNGQIDDGKTIALVCKLELEGIDA